MANYVKFFCASNSYILYVYLFQQFYQQRPQTTRISNHRAGPVVGMQANVGGQQMYQQHVSS